MTNSLLDFSTNEIKVSPGSVTFNGFEGLKQQAQTLADEIVKVEVTDENIKTNKKMLAAVNKRVKEISDKRIQIKKEILESYNDFESQVKEITTIVKDADDHVRQQVKQLEEQEREEKEGVIREIFEKRIKQYEFNNVFTFDDFLVPKFLNKSVSVNRVEEAMVEWLENKESDFNAIKVMDNAHDVLMEYKDTKDLGVALNNIKQHEEQRKKLEEVVPKPKKTDKQHVFTLQDEKDAKMVEMFMEQNNIRFEKVVN